MKKLFLTPIRLVLSFVKGCAGLAAVAAIVLAVLLSRTETTGFDQDEATIRELQTIIARQEQQIADQEARIEELVRQAETTYLVHRQVQLRLLPELDWEWLEFSCFDFWDEVGRSTFESCFEGQQEILFSSGILEWSFTTLELAEDA